MLIFGGSATQTSEVFLFLSFFRMLGGGKSAQGVSSPSTPSAHLWMFERGFYVNCYCGREKAGDDSRVGGNGKSSAFLLL